jgi:hypothetical protein
MLTTKSRWLKYIILTSLFQITFVGNYQNRNLAVNKVLLDGGGGKKKAKQHNVNVDYSTSRVVTMLKHQTVKMYGGRWWYFSCILDLSTRWT